MAFWQKIIGTQTGRFILGLTGASIKNNSGTIEVRNNADSAYAPVTAETVAIHNNTAGFSNTLRTQATQAANYVYDLPLDDGAPGQVLQTDGTGVLSWVTAGSNASSLKNFTKTVNFGDSSPITLFTLPAGDTIERVSIIIDTAFDTAATISVGVNGGSASKYAASGDSLLTVADRYDIPNQIAPVGVTEDLEVAYSAAAATVGVARVIVWYYTPAV